MPIFHFFEFYALTSAQRVTVLQPKKLHDKPEYNLECT